MKGTINIKGLRLLLRARTCRFEDPLFVLDCGSKVFSGDTVEFYVDDNVFPSSGTVSNYKGLRVDCFNTLMNKWEYYRINT